MATTPDERLAALAAADPAAAKRLIASLRRKLWVPHEGGQRDVLASQARFRLLRAGRRWGKTQLAAHEVIMAAVSNPGSMVWWVSQSDKTVRRGYRAVKKQLPRELLAKPAPSEGANDRILQFTNGSSIEFYTAGTPDSLAGEGVDFLVVDEAALIEENVWFQLLRPTLSDTKGRALIISTPRGRNWFWKLCKRGELGGEYESFHFKSIDSPYIDLDEVEDAKETLPNILFRQEYLAEFVANAASIFDFTDDVIVPELVEPTGHVILGIDLAKKEDFTVISGANAKSRRPCVYQRLNEVSWPVQEELIRDTYYELMENPNVEHVTCVVDSTGIGDVVYDHLEEHGLDVIPINFGSGLQKERMVRLLAADLEHKRAFLFEPSVTEFESYEYEITANGRYKFEAGAGHDDAVSAKLLENWGIVHEAPPDMQVWDPQDEPGKTDLLKVALKAVEPDSRREIMNRPEVWSSFRH